MSLLQTKFHKEIELFAKQNELDPFLVAAIVATESSFDSRALRYEKHYRWFHEPKKYAKDWNVSLDTEQALQRFSYGLMQVMGGTARWLGFEGYLHDLTRPDIGLYWGCKYFASLLKKHGDRDKAIASYNAGSPRRLQSGVFENQSYVDKVNAKRLEYLHANNSAASADNV